MRLPDLEAWAIFASVVEHRSFSAAADAVGLSKATVSKAITRLEAHLGQSLFHRTSRRLALTEAGKPLAEHAARILAEARAAEESAHDAASAHTGRVRLAAPMSFGVTNVAPILAEFLVAHPGIEVDFHLSDARVDIVAEGFDAGIRLSEYVERDMVSLRLTGPLRFVVVGAPSYLEKHGTPQRPEDLLQHECLTFRSSTTGALYAWELERGKQTWRVPVKGGIVTNDGLFCIDWAEQGLGLAYVYEPLVAEQLRSGRLQIVLDPYAASVPGFYLYYPSRAQRSAPLQLFTEVLREVVGEQLAAARDPSAR